MKARIRHNWGTNGLLKNTIKILLEKKKRKKYWECGLPYEDEGLFPIPSPVPVTTPESDDEDLRSVSPLENPPTSSEAADSPPRTPKRKKIIIIRRRRRPVILSDSNACDYSITLDHKIR